MGNVLRVFWRDLKRLAHAPAAWIVALFLIVLPSLYAWINVYGFWNPYDNTGNLHVCVVNEDTGTEDKLLGSLDLGAGIVADLESNTQMGWTFVEREKALEEVASGEAYAAFIIPEDFSSKVAALATGSLEQAKIEYYVNEKTGPVAPKIMDKGANALDETINSAFVSQVSSTVTKIIGDETAKVKADVEAATTASYQRVDKAIQSLGDIRTSIQDLDAASVDAQSRSEAARGTLESERDTLASLSDDLATAANLVGEANESAARLSLSLGSALDNGSDALSLGTAKTDLAIANTAAKITAAKGHVDGAVGSMDNVVQEQDRIIALLEAVESILPDGDVKTAMGERIDAMIRVNDEAKQLLSDLSTLSGDISNAATNVADASSAADTATQDALSNASQYRSSVNDDTLPAVSGGVSALANASTELASTTASMNAIIDQATGTLWQLETTLAQASKAFGETDGLLESAQGELGDIRTDLATLGSADALHELLGKDIDPEKVASFMMAPTTVKSEELYPLNAYGSAMAPLFINLTLWIGVFMLMVIMRIEVDEEGLERSTVPQRYLGRQLLLACMAALQAVVCCVGCLIIGVQVASIPLFILTAATASLAYLSIQYALSSTFQHLGKALCVILVFVQIPGATGLYPIEMTTDFFRAVYPLFPFTYGINAIRETVFGLYGNLWIGYIAMLLGFMAAFTAIGALARPLTANLNRLFERQIEETDLINIEPVQLPDRRYRISELISVLSGRDEYRQSIEERSGRFMRNYQRYKLGAVIAGIAMPIIVTPIFVATGIDKVVILSAWLVWLIAIGTFLVIVEYLRDNLLHQLSLTDLPSGEISKLYFEGKSSGHRRHVALRKLRGRAADDSAEDAEDGSAAEQEVPR